MKSGKRRRRRSSEAAAACPWCGEPFEVWIDEGAGSHQRYVEDCAVCCHPCVVAIEPADDPDEPARVSVERE